MHKFKKSFGQNFLKDENILNKIVSYVPLNSNILEIGPGDGALTKKLIKKSLNVVSIELDNDLEEKLENIKKNNANFNYIMNDILKLDITEFEQKNYIIVANIPYNISTEIIFKFLYSNIKTAILMVQKEYAERVIAKPLNKEYSKLSVTCNFFCNTRKLFDVKNTSFYPVPKVDSSVIMLEKKEFLSIENKNIEKFINFIKSSFSFKRKTLINNINTNYKIDKEIILDAFEKLNIDLKQRAESISVDKFIMLFKEIFKNEG